MILRPSASMKISENALGRIVSFSGQAQWKHPWFTDPHWSERQKKWICIVQPGFVNGVCPMVSTTVADSRETFFGQLIDARSGSAEIAQAARLASMSDGDDTPIDLPLYKRPPVPLSAWKRVTAVPEFFQDRGAVPPPTVDANLFSGQLIISERKKDTRVLLSCDVVVNQPRTTLSSEITIDPSGILTGESLVKQTLVERAPSGEETLRMQTGDWDEINENKMDFSAASHLVDQYEEKPWDRVLISTVYLLSPPDAPEDAEPDADWEPYAQHHVFWNLHWAQPRLGNIVLNSDEYRGIIGTMATLGGGSGFVWSTTVLAQLNDAVQSAYNILTASSLAGDFWTATGGGTMGEPAKIDMPKTIQKKTLNKAKNAQKKRDASWEEKSVRRLDPIFPYQGRSFNPAFIL